MFKLPEVTFTQGRDRGCHRQEQRGMSEPKDRPD